MCWQGATLLGREEVCERERAEGKERQRDNTPLWALVGSSGSTSPCLLGRCRRRLPAAEPQEGWTPNFHVCSCTGPYPRHLGGSRQQDASTGILKIPKSLWSVGSWSELGWGTGSDADCGDVVSISPWKTTSKTRFIFATGCLIGD